MDREETPLKQISTFQGDVAEALQKQRESLVSIQRAEHFKKGFTESATDTPLENSKRKQFFYLSSGSFLFLALGIIGSWYAYDEFVRKTTAPTIAVPANRFISANTNTSLNLTNLSRETLISTLSDATSGVARGELKHVVLKKIVGDENRLISTSEFLNMMESQAPGNLIRAFDPLFMFGAFGENVFFIIKLTSFENAFAGMLAWEKSLSRDIGPLFATAKLLRNVPIEPNFTDIIDRNKDIRILTLE